MSHTGTYTLRDRVHFTKFPTGNYIAAVRVESGGSPPPMLAALMRPGPQRSMDINDLHLALGHAHDANAAETARQRKMKVTGYRNYCDGCGDTKAIKESVPKKRTDAVAERPAKRQYMDITGPFPASAGKSRYCLQIVDDNTSICWPLFMPDKSGSTVCNNVRTWYIENRERIQFHGGWEIGRFDNASEFTSAEFKQVLMELSVKAEYTPPGGPKRNGRVERRLALIAEGAKAGWVEFPLRFPDIKFPGKANNWQAIWPEAFAWMADRLNITAQAPHAADKRSPWEKFYGKVSPIPLLPFMMPGNRHRVAPRANKMQSKGERIFYLNSGRNHSSTTHKVLSESGVRVYTADATFGYSRRAWVGEVTPRAGGVSGGSVFDEVEDVLSSAAAAVAPGGRASLAASAERAAGLPAAAAGDSSSTVAAVAGSIATPAASAGGMAGQPASLSRASSSLVAPTPGGSALPAAPVGRAAGRSALPVGVGASSSSLAAGMSDGGVSPAALEGRRSGNRSSQWEQGRHRHRRKRRLAVAVPSSRWGACRTMPYTEGRRRHRRTQDRRLHGRLQGPVVVLHPPRWGVARPRLQRRRRN